jgi:hypothetical protein
MLPYIYGSAMFSSIAAVFVAWIWYLITRWWQCSVHFGFDAVNLCGAAVELKPEASAKVESTVPSPECKPPTEPIPGLALASEAAQCNAPSHQIWLPTDQVHITPKGRRFHIKATCSSVKGNAGLKPIELRVARLCGFKPCQVCSIA